MYSSITSQGKYSPVCLSEEVLNNSEIQWPRDTYVNMTIFQK